MTQLHKTQQTSTALYNTSHTFTTLYTTIHNSTKLYETLHTSTQSLQNSTQVYTQTLQHFTQLYTTRTQLYTTYTTLHKFAATGFGAPSFLGLSTRSKATTMTFTFTSRNHYKFMNLFASSLGSPTVLQNKKSDFKTQQKLFNQTNFTHLSTVFAPNYIYYTNLYTTLQHFTNLFLYKLQTTLQHFYNTNLLNLKSNVTQLYNTWQKPFFSKTLQHCTTFYTTLQKLYKTLHIFI